jgi:hypothetical protein
MVVEVKRERGREKEPKYNYNPTEILLGIQDSQAAVLPILYPFSGKKGICACSTRGTEQGRVK